VAAPLLREALRRERPQPPADVEHEDRPRDDPGGEPPARIRCPRCGWRHDGKPHWGCDACYVLFDTFVTRATCPACSKTWQDTQCPSCHQHSPHLDWYARDDAGS
jgi:hypothetical protein